MVKNIENRTSGYSVRDRSREPIKPVDINDYIDLSDAKKAELERRMDLYFATPLEMFPVGENGSQIGIFGDLLESLSTFRHKPERFHAFYEKVIEVRFPDDATLRKRMRGYVTLYTKHLFWQIFWKRLIYVLAVGMTILAIDNWSFHIMKIAIWPVIAIPIYLTGALIFFWTANKLFYSYQRRDLQLCSAFLVQDMNVCTQGLKNLFIQIRARPDQLETRYMDDGETWGGESYFLMRLLVWIGKRLEYIEKYMQIELWRIRRARYWWDGASVLILLTLMGIFIWRWSIDPLTGFVGGDAWLQPWVRVIGLVLCVVLALLSFGNWNAPLDLAQDQLSQESWIRFGDLKLDDVIGDQVRRDKERLVEYRTLNKGRDAPGGPRAPKPPGTDR